jgi:predicted DCC family thiol-disulfide oxidoreductase YuxK
VYGVIARNRYRWWGHAAGGACAGDACKWEPQNARR